MPEKLKHKKIEKVDRMKVAWLSCGNEHGEVRRHLLDPPITLCCGDRITLTWEIRIE